MAYSGVVAPLADAQANYTVTAVGLPMISLFASGADDADLLLSFPVT